MRTKKVRRSFAKTLRGGNGVTKGLKLYANSKAFNAAKEFYEDPTNPLLSSSKSTQKSRSSVTKHRNNMFRKLKKLKNLHRK
jgi:hypothetical protein